MIDNLMLTGRSAAHLAPINEGPHRLQPEAVEAFTRMQDAARLAGFNLQPASTFRDFERQLAIWNGKFRGERPVLDKESRPVEVASLSDAERCELILRWSALPGASRHHWGSDLDISSRGELVDAVVNAVRHYSEITPELQTTGGTSDGRFIALMGAQVVELGPVNATIHKINECVQAADLQLLSRMYQRIMEQLVA